LDYPHDRFKVLVLDDGAQDELKAICENLQIEEGGGGGGGGDIDASGGLHDADNIDQTIMPPPRRLQ
jgi:cellulose synthase/poly-beta-1,6-N-acetylglucosamine synthase-like glycosyltransferase